MTKAERYRRCEEGYQLELARSASHISSCMTEESTTRCIDEALRAFIRDRGAADLAIFRQVLADRLQARGCAIGAKLVIEWNPVAQPNVTADPIPSGKVSALAFPSTRNTRRAFGT